MHNDLVFLRYSCQEDIKLLLEQLLRKLSHCLDSQLASSEASIGCLNSQEFWRALLPCIISSIIHMSLSKSLICFRVAIAFFVGSILLMIPPCSIFIFLPSRITEMIPGRRAKFFFLFMLINAKSSSVFQY